MQGMDFIRRAKIRVANLYHETIHGETTDQLDDRILKVVGAHNQGSIKPHTIYAYLQNIEKSVRPSFQRVTDRTHALAEAELLRIVSRTFDPPAPYDRAHFELTQAGRERVAELDAAKPKDAAPKLPQQPTRTFRAKQDLDKK